MAGVNNIKPVTVPLLAREYRIIQTEMWQIESVFYFSMTSFGFSSLDGHELI